MARDFRVLSSKWFTSDTHHLNDVNVRVVHVYGCVVRLHFVANLLACKCVSKNSRSDLF